MKYGHSCGVTTAFAVLFLVVLPMGAQQQKTGRGSTVVSGDEAKSTPRMPDGHPDLSGTWYTNGHVPSGPGHEAGATLADGSRIAVYAQEQLRGPIGAAGPRPQRSSPTYKPELVAKTNYLEANTVKEDPAFFCRPPGLPRIGPPQKIISGVDGELAFLYSDLNGNFWRVIPTDGRPHNKDFDPSYLGDSVGHWEGDTLVIDVTNFNDDSWLGDPGWFHTEALHVTEKLSREGDVLHYDVTVEDPNVLAKPWTVPTRNLKLSKEQIEEGPYCVNLDSGEIVNLDHHGNPR